MTVLPCAAGDAWRGVMMLGESVVVVGAGGGGGGSTTSSSGEPLHRPRSADNLARLAPASSIPALDDLAESEVFVGKECLTFSSME